MASSVSSERAFSSAGLTITKRRNRLKADIVEALQALNCAIRNDLLIRPQGTTLEEDEGFSSDDEEGGETAEQKRAKEREEGEVLCVELSDSDEEDTTDIDNDVAME